MSSRNSSNIPFQSIFDSIALPEGRNGVYISSGKCPVEKNFEKALSSAIALWIETGTGQVEMQ